MLILGIFSIILWLMSAISYLALVDWLGFGVSCLFLAILVNGLGSFSASSSADVRETATHIHEETSVNMTLNPQYMLVVLATVIVTVYYFIRIFMFGG